MAESSAVSAGSASKSSVTEEVFLTPRVIDEQACRDFASALRTLVEQGAALLAQLTAQSDQGRTLRADLESSARDLKEQVHTGARLLRTLQEETRRLEPMAQTVGERVERLAERAEQVERQAAERLESMLLRFDETLEETLRRLFAQRDEALAEISAVRRDLNRRLAETHASDAALSKRLEHLQEEVTSVLENAAAPLRDLYERTSTLLGYDPLDRAA